MALMGMDVFISTHEDDIDARYESYRLIILLGHLRKLPEVKPPKKTLENMWTSTEESDISKKIDAIGGAKHGAVVASTLRHDFAEICKMDGSIEREEAEIKFENLVSENEQEFVTAK
jgi:hypothetical protein